MSSTDDMRQPFEMGTGPSPILPLLLVVGLGLLLRGTSSSITLDLPLVSSGENALFTCFLFIPVLVVVAVYSTAHTILLPLAVILTVYTVSTILLGPLMLILIVCIAAAYLPSVQGNGDELGWGCVLVLAFFVLHWGLSHDSRQSGALVLAVVIFLCYHCLP